MKSLKFTQRIARALCGISLVCLSASADDTEIYFGNNSSSVSAIKPNILLILDTSSSMTNTVSGTGKSRLDNMKEALDSLISNANNVNMGLMRFSRAGGPVLYPVKDVDEAVSTPGEVVTRIAEADDDAQQRPSGEVLLNESAVTVSQVDLSNTTVEIVLEDGNDDAEQDAPAGGMSPTSSDLELMFDRGDEQLVGLRFTDIPAALTPGTSIISAVIEFTDDGDSKTNSSDLEIEIRAELGGDTGSFSARNISSRNLTSERITWEPSDFDASDKLQTDNLATVIEEVINDPGWSTGEPLTFVFSHISGSGIRVASSYNGDSSKAARLILTYSAGTGSENQTAGLRFQEVAVPKGATINSATLEFVVKEATSDATSFNVHGQLIGNAPAFTNTINDLSPATRTRTTNKTVWTPSGWTTVGETVTDLDVKDIVEEIVNHADWCGNNAMAFFLEGIGKRIAESYDSNPSLAPVLRINYDPTSVPSPTCINKIYSYRVLNSSDDAEEKASSNAYLNSSDLELVEDNGTQEVGVRFSNIQIPKDAVIQSAYLEFTAKDTQTGATSLTIYGDAVDDSPTFGVTTNKVRSRTKTSSVAWNSVPAWNSGEIYRSPDIATIVQTLVKRAGWSEGNAMSFIITGSGRRRAWSMDGSGGQAPRLVIQTENTSYTSTTKTVRDELIDIVDGIQYKSGTPIVGTYYEAAKYFRGEGVDVGKQRGNDGSSRREHTRVSHSESWDPGTGTLVRAAGCTDANLSSTDCRTENIAGSPTYISPITQSCQKNHIVILTDGQASSNEAEDKVKTLIGASSCADSGNQACGPELATWLRSTDQMTGTGMDGDQTITTHTIGFNFTGDWIKSISANGGGGFYEANTADQLLTAFEAIVTDALKSNSTFVSPAAAINQFNRLNHLDHIYFSVFKPTEDARWEGNVKKYQLGGATNEIRDASGNAAIDSSTGFFKDSSKSFWSSVVDGAEVAAGGAAENLPAFDAPRPTYTYTGTSTTLSHATNAIHPSSDTYNAAVTKAMLGDVSMSDEKRKNLMSWMSGEDVLDEDNDSSTTSRTTMADPLHSKPIVFTHGGNAANPELTLLFGTNDGHFRAVNAADGVQRWSFIPPELLPVSKTLYENVTNVHPYGVDGAPVLWVNDPDFDGSTIDLSGTDNFAYVYFGMRRGGRNYYALDVTDIDDPKLLWKIEGGSGDFVELGQSWSRPVKTKITLNITGSIVEKDVLIFSGGYDEDQDDASVRTADDLGRALFIVDAKTGDLIWSGGPQAVGFTKQFTDMQYSIPASPAVADVNNDGYADQIYVGDVGGQVWRFDIKNGNPAASLVFGGVIAEVSTAASAANTRRFYHTPDLAILKDGLGITKLSIFIGSGFHAHPLNKDTDDRFYLIQMPDVYSAPASYTKITEANLYDATDNDIGEGTAVEQAAAQTALNGKNGWFIRLTNDGEKVLSTPLTINGQVVFTTYEPKTSSSGCSIQPGTSREYVLRARNATPTINLNGTGDDDLTKEDRSRTLSTGSIVDEPVVIFTDTGGGSTFLGTEQGSLNIGTDRVIRTFWYQE